MRDWELLYKGPCRGCGEKRGCYKGLCLPCRAPFPIRELIRFGVPWSTAHALLYTVRKCKNDRLAQQVLTLVHPIVMENIKITGKKMTVIDKKWRWFRRNGWHKVSTS